MKKILLIIFIFIGSVLFAENVNYGNELKDAIMKNDVKKVEEYFANQNKRDYLLFPYEVYELFELSIKKNRTEIIKLFIDDGVEVNHFIDYSMHDFTPLFYACQNNNQEIIDLLLKKGAIPLYDEVPDFDMPSFLILNSIFKKNITFLRLCIDYGFEPKKMFNLTESLLNESLESNNIEAFKIFIEEGVEIDSINLLNDYKTTLAIAIDKYGENSEYVRILEEKGAYGIDYRYPRPYKGYCNTNNLRIRSKPNTNSEIIGLLQENDEVKMLGVTPLSYNIDNMTFPWVYIDKDNMTGWVFGGYIEKEVLENKGVYH